MIGFFPTPYPGESFYSLCARYADKVRYASRLALTQELTGAINPIQFEGIPSRLNHLVEALPPGHLLSVDLLIANHTLFPAYAAFWSHERTQRVRAAMTTGSRAKVEATAGLAGFRIQPSETLRYCPKCHTNDQECYGEAYWHRLHQMPGVEVCPRHKVFLEESQVERRTTGRWGNLVTAEEGAMACDSRAVNDSNTLDAQLLAIAHDIEWLFEHSQYGTESQDLRNRYLKCLVGRRLANWSGRLRGREIIRSIKHHYSDMLLDRLQCSVESVGRTTWILRLLHETRARSAHPIHHLLAIHWLGLDIKAFLNLSPKIEPFGPGPWPCLNPARPHSDNLLVHDVEWHLRKDTPVGVFCCPACGFMYSRTRQERAENEPPNVGKVLAYGKVWDERLKTLWNNARMDLKMIQAELGVSFATVRRQAKRAGLSLARRGSRIKLESPTTIKPGSIRSTHTKRLKRYQVQWLKLQTNNPTVSRTYLAKRYPKIKTYLYRHARKWFLLNQPPRKIRRDWPGYLNWEGRDKEFAKEVRQIIRKLRRHALAPKPISLYVIRGLFRRSGRYCLTLKYRSRLPRTFAVLRGP